MRAVLDTNVLISSVIATGVPHDIVVKGFRSEYQIVVSVATLTAFRDTLLEYPEKCRHIIYPSTETQKRIYMNKG